MDVRWVIWGLMTCRSVSMLWPCQHTYLDCFRCFCHFIVAPPTVLHCRSLHCHSLALSLLLYVAQLLRPTLSVTPNSLTVTLLLSLAWHPWLCHSRTLSLRPLFCHGVTVRRSFCSSSTWFPFQPDEIMIPSRCGFTAQLECFVNKRISQ